MIGPTARQHDKSSGDESAYTFPQRSFRVLMIAASPFPLPQGSQVLIAGLSESLQQRGHQVEIVAYPTGKKQPHLSVPIRRAPSIPLYRHLNPGPSFWKPLMDVILAREVLSSVRQKRPDILHTHNFEGLLVGLWVSRKTHIPVVYHLHNLMEPELPAYFRFWPLQQVGRLFGRWIDRNLLRQADSCILLNEDVIACLQDLGVSRERVHVVPPGIDLPKTAPAPPGEVRRRWNLGVTPLILYSGNFDRYQDLEFLLQAFQFVREANPEVQLVLVTHQGIEKKRQRALQHSLGDWGRLIAVSGWEEMYELLTCCEVAVSPRQACWGFPIKVLNYMAAGRPIVAAAGSAQGLHHMRTAWVVPNSDVRAFGQGIITLLKDRELAERLGRAAGEEVRQHYTWPACAQAVEQVYARLV